jgi:hypothetical protein
MAKTAPRFVDKVERKQRLAQRIQRDNDFDPRMGWKSRDFVESEDDSDDADDITPPSKRAY